MKIVLTGSLGHISKPLSEDLVKRGHNVTVISSKADKQPEIESLGASAAIGSLEDVDFLTSIFTGVDAVYCMIPPNNYFDQDLDLIAYYETIGHNYAQAIMQSGVKRIVNLSTIGGHLEAGNGILLGAHNVQNILDQLPGDVAITHMRPVSFFYNLYGYVDTIKTKNAIITNYGTDRKIPWVSPFDIADAVADEIVTPLVGRKIRYVASEELTGPETASILGEAIGKPDLKWIIASDDDVLKALVAAGMNKKIAMGLVEMYASLQSGVLSDHYFDNRPAVMGKVKLKDFSKDFANVYNS